MSVVWEPSFTLLLEKKQKLPDFDNHSGLGAMQPHPWTFRHVGLAHLSRWLIRVNFYNFFRLQISCRLKGRAARLEGPIPVNFFFNHFQRCIVELVNLEKLETKLLKMDFYLLSVSFLLDTRLRIRSSRTTFTNTGTATAWCTRNHLYWFHCFTLVQKTIMRTKFTWKFFWTFS